MSVLGTVMAGLVGFALGGESLYGALVVLAAVVGWRALRSP